MVTALPAPTLLDRQFSLLAAQEFVTGPTAESVFAHLRSRAARLLRPGDPPLPNAAQPWAARDISMRLEQLEARERSEPRGEEVIVNLAPPTDEERHRRLRSLAWERFVRENLDLRAEALKHSDCLEFLETTRDFITRYATAVTPPWDFSIDYENEHHVLCLKWKRLDDDDKARLSEILAERRAREAAASMEQRLSRIEEQVAALIKQSQ